MAEKIGVLDFAGGAVVHISSGFGALACAIVLGKRKEYGTENMPPHNLPMSVLGAGLLWFGVVWVQCWQCAGGQRDSSRSVRGLLIQQPPRQR